jgi:hypothetical protein
MLTSPPPKRDRCRYCGRELPAWLPVAQAPDGPRLVHHLSAMHPTEVGPYLGAHADGGHGHGGRGGLWGGGGP